MISRRQFFENVVGVAGLLATSGARAEASTQLDLLGEDHGRAENLGASKLPMDRTSLRSQKTRQQCALLQSQRPIPEHVNNGDEKVLPQWSGNFTKGLPHVQSGEVEPARYETLLKALETGSPDAFQKIARGSGMRLVSPQAAFSLHLEGADAQSFLLAPPPSVSSPRGRGVRLGEEVAITILEDLVNTFAEDFPGFQFTRFDGTPVHITKMA